LVGQIRDKIVRLKDLMHLRIVFKAKFRDSRMVFLSIYLEYCHLSNSYWLLLLYHFCMDLGVNRIDFSKHF
jgi:hypothetical protein